MEEKEKKTVKKNVKKETKTGVKAPTKKATKPAVKKATKEKKVEVVEEVKEIKSEARPVERVTVANTKEEKNYKSLAIIFIALFAVETLAILIYLGIKFLGGSSSVVNTAWVLRYEEETNSQIVLEFQKDGKFEYSNTYDGETINVSGEYQQIGDKVYMRFQDDEMAYVLYKHKDYICISSDECTDDLKLVKYDGKVEKPADEPKKDPVYTEDTVPTIYVFHGDGCPHCQEFFEWLDTFKYGKKYNVVKYEVWYDSDNAQLMQKVGKYLGVDASGVPYIVIGDKVLSGFSKTSSPDEIKSYLDKAYEDLENKQLLDVVKTVNQ